MTGRFDDYRVLGPLARGGQAEVLRAEHGATGLAVALKLFPAPADARDARRVAAEATALARVEHPGVARALGVGTAPDGRPWLALALVEGETLAARVARAGPLPPEQAARVAGELADALAACHAAGVAHRDVNPRNVVLEGATDRAVLVDFGLSLVADGRTRLTTSGEVSGTPGYFAPEQVDPGSFGLAGPPADVWGLGATLHYLLTGVAPFAAPTLVNAAALVLEGPTPGPRDRAPATPAALDAACRAALARDPARRPTAAAFAAALRGGPALAAAGGRRARRGRAARAAVRRRALAAAGCLLAVAALGVAAALTRGRGAPQGPGPSFPEAWLRPPPWPVPPPPAGWTRAAAFGPARPLGLGAPALFEADGRTAAPIAAALEGRPGAREAALMGRVTAPPGPDGELEVSYPGSALLPLESTEPGWVLGGADAPADHEVTVEGEAARLFARDDTGSHLRRLGHARWRAPVVALDVRQPGGAGPPRQIDQRVLFVDLEPAGGPRALRAAVGAREGAARIHTPRAPGQRAPLHGAFAAPAGRVVVDARAGRLRVDDADLLDGFALSGASAPAVALVVGVDEGDVVLGPVRVQGRLARTDRPALGRLGAPEGPLVRAAVTAWFDALEGGAAAGPCVGWTSEAGDDPVALLELGPQGLLLWLDGEAVGFAPAPWPPAEPVQLTLARDVDRWTAEVHAGKAATGSGEAAPAARLEVAHPLPLPPLRQAVAGSVGGRCRVVAATVDVGPDDADRRALDLAFGAPGVEGPALDLALDRALASASSAAGAAEAGGDGLRAGAARWRLGALRLARLHRWRWIDPAAVGRARREARKAAARAAADDLERATHLFTALAARDGAGAEVAAEVAGAAGEPAAVDARARAVLARVVLEDDPGAYAAARRLVEAAGLERARAAVDGLLRGPLGEPRLLARLSVAYGGDRAPWVSAAGGRALLGLGHATRAASRLVLQGVWTAHEERCADARGDRARRTESAGAALAELEEARRALELDLDLDAAPDLLGGLYFDLGRFADAVDAWERRVAQEPAHWYGWTRLAEALTWDRRLLPALERALVALALNRGSPNVASLVQHVVGQPGLPEAARLVGAEALRLAQPQDAAPAGLAEALSRRAAQALAGAPDERWRDLAAWALLRGGVGVPAPAGDRPTAVLARAAAGDRAALAALPRAAEDDVAVWGLAALDPALSAALGPAPGGRGR